MTSTILTSVLAHGGSTARYGDFIVVHLHDSSFITTPFEYTQSQNWARERASCGDSMRDRTLFVDHFETILGHAESGIASRGSRPLLSRIVKSMKANALTLEDWSIPRDLEAGVEIRRPAQPACGVVRSAPAANETMMSCGVTPLVRK